MFLLLFFFQNSPTVRVSSGNELATRVCVHVSGHLDQRFGLVSARRALKKNLPKNLNNATSTIDGPLCVECRCAVNLGPRR